MRTPFWSAGSSNCNWEKTVVSSLSAISSEITYVATRSLAPAVSSASLICTTVSIGSNCALSPYFILWSCLYACPSASPDASAITSSRSVAGHRVGQATIFQDAAPHGHYGSTARDTLEKAQGVLFERLLEEDLQVVQQDHLFSLFSDDLFQQPADLQRSSPSGQIQ